MNAQILTAIAVGCIALVVLGVVITFGAKVMSDIRDTQTNNATYQSDSWKVGNNSLGGLVNVSGWQGTLGTLLIAFGIIGAFMGLFAYKRGQNGM